MNLNPASILLNVTQKGILAIIASAPTPELAFENTQGLPALVSARNILERLGLIEVAQNKAVLTQAGRNAVVSNNIQDESGQLTDDATQMIERINNAKKERAVVEKFELLKSLI